MKIGKAFSFSSGHHLPLVPEGHQCRERHGHNYCLWVVVLADHADNEGMVMDFFELEKIVWPILEPLDHHYLNDVQGLANPTAENICQFIFTRLHKKLMDMGGPRLTRCRLYETDSCYAEMQL